MMHRKVVRVIAGWQILGGAIGALTFLDRLVRAPHSGGSGVAYLTPVLALCVISVLAGRALLLGHAPAAARGWSLLVWLPQIAGFRIGVVAFRLAVQPYVFLNLVPSQGIGASAAFRPHLVLYFHTPAPVGDWVTINVLALACVFGLLFVRTAVSDVPAVGEPNLVPPAT